MCSTSGSPTATQPLAGGRHRRAANTTRQVSAARITGRRADLVVIDDPIRSFEDASSELIRNKQWDWFATDLRTRLKPGARIVLIQTRWHEDDLAGRILADMATGGEQWHVISLPAEAEADDPLGREPGAWLWDEGPYGYGAVLRREKAVQPPRNWSALYQQRPAPEEGDYFKAEWLKPYDIAPPRETAADLRRQRLRGDAGRRRLHRARRRRHRSRSSECSCSICGASRPRPTSGWTPCSTSWRSGSRSAGPTRADRSNHRSARSSTAAMIERQVFVAGRAFPTRFDKAIRAQSIRGRMAVAGLYVPTRAPWLADLRAELLGFPAAKHDDQVDALGLIGQLLDVMRAGAKPPPAEKPKAHWAGDGIFCVDDLLALHERSRRRRIRV